MSLTVIVDYESGNLHSAEKAFQRMAAETGAGAILVSSRPEDVVRADRIVLPGDGAFPSCHAALSGRAGLFALLKIGRKDRHGAFHDPCALDDLGEEHFSRAK